MTLIILVADGARPDTLFGAMDDGQLPALAALRTSGAAYSISSVFPSVTGSAYTPFLLGLHPGRAGLPGLRWYDRDRSVTLAPANARSYVGLGGLRANSDLTATHKTLFELEPQSLGGFSYVSRGLHGERLIGSGPTFTARMAWTHFRGDLDGWMRFDRWLGEEFVRRIVAQRPRLAFLAHPGIDKFSHRFGQEHPRALEAMQTVDHTVALLHSAFRGREVELEIWIVSDHGHARIHSHEDLAGRIAEWGYSVRAHPWVIGGRDVAVMVSGNAMAHLYLDLSRRTRPRWDALSGRFAALREKLLTLPSVDLLLSEYDGAGACTVQGAGRGAARVTRDADGLYAYERLSGDPLQLGGNFQGLSADAAWQLTQDGAYPDALVQVHAIASAPRAGELIISAAEGCDLRSRWEPIDHKSGHGALLRQQMMVPFICSRLLVTTPQRTTDIFPTALRTLGLALPEDLDGVARR